MITTNRDIFVGGHVTPRVRDARRTRALQEGVSVSRLIYKILLKALKLTDDEERP